MARTALTDQPLNTRAGLAFSVSAAGDVANGNSFVWGPRKFLAVRNSSGTTAYNITFTTPNENLDGFASPTRVVSIPASAIRFFGPFPGSYKNASDGDTVYVNVANAALLLKVYDMAEGV
jgi:hypothetical protein